MRLGVAGALRAMPVQQWDRLFQRAPRAMRARPFARGDRIHKLAAILSYETLDATYRRFITHWPEPEAIVPGSVEASTVFTAPPAGPEKVKGIRRLMYLDSISYLPDDIFAKVDRAAMAISLETRAPLVDQRVVEFAWRIPRIMHYREGRGKRLLRLILDKYVPSTLIERPKMGFGVPIAEWLSGPLRDWAEALISPSRMRVEGFFDVVCIRDKWDEHQASHRRWHYLLWDVLMFQAWLEHQ
jgi:asparagine synthase (glutamine-hydrolysing)